MQGILECLTKQKMNSSPGNHSSVKAGSFVIAIICQTGNETRKRNFHFPLVDQKEPEESLARHALRTSAVSPKLSSYADHKRLGMHCSKKNNISRRPAVSTGLCAAKDAKIFCALR